MHNCIQTEDLKPGMVIVQVTKQNGPLKIRKSGLVTSVEMVQGLLEMGIQEVQIDPSQTVELETSVPAVQSSFTMQLLQSRGNKPANADHQLHDQFNRSLFLPSVQDIPSQWQFYLKRVASMGLLILAGLTLGFGAAYLPSVLSLRSPLVVAGMVDETSDKSLMSPTTSGTTTVVAISPSNTTTPALTPSLTNEATTESMTQLNTDVAVSHEQKNDIQAADTQPAETVEVVQQSTPPTPEPVSPELLKRFEKVIQQMDREERYAKKDTQTPQTLKNPDSEGPIMDLSDFPILDEQGEIVAEQRKTSIQVVKNNTVEHVPRIDQLPESLMGELPKMAFSAHMYASLPSERWVRVNGHNRREGELIDNKVQIVKIAAQHVILSYAGHEFSMQAMTDW
jgi:general secretion pathway protein B